MTLRRVLVVGYGNTLRGELRHTQAHVIDILPTIFEILEIEKPTEWKGEEIPPERRIPETRGKR